ncbi:hypothetical protein NMG60_11013655 [Bertholletia excelsa]
MASSEGQQSDTFWKYLPLHRAAAKGCWESARQIIQEDEEAPTAIVNINEETALHVVVLTGKAIHFVKELVKFMPKEALSMRNNNGQTALFLVARVGYTEAATILLEEDPGLLYIRDNNGNLPVAAAASCAQRHTLIYLLSVTASNKHLNPDPFPEQEDVFLLIHILECGYFDVALDLIKQYPHLATFKSRDDATPLQTMAQTPWAFRRGSRLNLLENLIYNVTWQPLNFTIWEVIGWLVPLVKHLKDKKLKHHQALQVVKLLCKQLERLPDPKDASSHTIDAVIEAAIQGNPEVIEEIVDIFPEAIWSNKSKHYMFHLAVRNRCENVFNLAYQMSKIRLAMMDVYVDNGNTILHLAGQLAPRYKLSLVSGAALQMQYELQWFKEVEKFMTPRMKNSANIDNKTPQEVFTEAHKDLVNDGEKWMKDTANSCTIAAALIVTIVFAAAITVPGGNNDENGEPFFLHKSKAFIIFAVSDAISLFASTTSLLMFLSILTARYAESDFLYALPRRLIIGLVTLFLSITFMMMAFGSTVYLMFGQGKAWILIGVAALASLPITSFVFLQFPLLVDVISSTYGPGVFGKKSDRAFR